jgi:hypothetical protein
MRNGGELSNLDYLPTKPENVEYLQNAATQGPRFFWPFMLHNNEFKQALDHKKRWRIEQTKLSTYKNRKRGISPEHGNTWLSSFCPFTLHNNELK